MCPSGKGDTNGYAAVVYLYAADLTLEQTSQPTVSSVEGELADAPTLSGTADISFHAEDPGSGVYEALFSVDGGEVGHVLLDENSGRCRDVGQTTDGLPAFLYLRPCRSSLNADIPFDTTTLSDGTHHLVVSVTNAAGNRTVALDRKITVSNAQVTVPQQPSSPGQGSSGNTGDASVSQKIDPVSQLQGVNGENASAKAKLQVRWSTTAKSSLPSAYGKAHTVIGTLTAPGGAPIGGALIQISRTPTYVNAKAVHLTSVRTAPNGSFSVRLASSTPSSRVTFSYAHQAGQVVPDVMTTLGLTVTAKLTLNITPRTSHVGGVINFTGVLRGAPLPPGGKQLVLEARTLRGRWRQFKVVSTNHHGGYHASYRFQLAGPVTYLFRVVSPKEADFPYGAGSSNVVHIRER